MASNDFLKNWQCFNKRLVAFLAEVNFSNFAKGMAQID